jgi:hypothetical protein
MAVPARGQENRKWEIEIDGGGLFASLPVAGSSSLPPPGEFIFNGASTSRRVVSWYFGDGALVLNQALLSLSRVPRIAPLDGALTAGALNRQNGWSVGARIRRALGSRYSAEFSLQYGAGTLKLTDRTLEQIDASTESFIAAWSSLANFSPLLTWPSITSTATVDPERGRQLFTTGAIEIGLRTRGRIVPYATAGAGLVSQFGGVPGAQLSGNYQIRIGTGSGVIDERDNVALRFAIPERRFVGLVGGGVRYHVSPRWGIRADVRAHVSRSRIDTLVDATPNVIFGTPLTLVNFGSTPFLQFRNFASPGAGTGGGQGNLSSPPLSAYRTFSGSGIENQVGLTVGWFWRL